MEENYVNQTVPNQNIEQVIPQPNNQEQTQKKDILENTTVLKMYAENLTEKKYITNPAIAREEEIRK